MVTCIRYEIQCMQQEKNISQNSQILLTRLYYSWKNFELNLKMNSLCISVTIIVWYCSHAQQI
jgi:hypothetical protein